MTLDQKRDEITKELIQCHFFYMFSMLKERKIRRLETYADWMYSFSGNWNPTLVDACRILKQHTEDFSLKNKRLQERVNALYASALDIKEELYMLCPRDRGLSANKDFAKLFRSKERTIFEKKAKEYRFRF